MNNASDIITIDVGGTLFKTTRTTLKQSPVFRSMFERWNGETVDRKVDTGTNNLFMPFVDRDGDAFKHVLSYLRDSQYGFPVKYRYELD